MVAGSVIVGINLMIIGWTKEVASIFISEETNPDHYATLVIWIAVISVYLLDFAINAGSPPKPRPSLRCSTSGMSGDYRGYITCAETRNRQCMGE
jgi:solute carrier family 45 protein 1/2/4